MAEMTKVMEKKSAENKDHPDHKVFCHCIYESLLESHIKINYHNSSNFIRSLFDTKVCDDVSDLSSMRKDIERDLSSEYIKDILNFEETWLHQPKIFGVILKHQTMHRDILKNIVPFYTRIYYKMKYPFR